MKRNLPALILSAAFCAFLLGGCKTKKPEPVDLSSIHTTAAPTQTETMGETTAPVKETAPSQGSTDKADSSKTGVSASIGTYQAQNISVEYPVAANMEDSQMEKDVNELLKSNALAVLKGYGVDDKNDSLKVQCKVITVDRRRICVTYTGSYTAKGAAHPVSLFYTNTVDLGTGSNIGLSDYGDAKTMAAYLTSPDCQYYEASSDVQSAAGKYFAEQKAGELEAIFANADFPIDGTEFPQSFSYEKQGVIYVSAPVPHAIGDYVLIQFTPETK